MPDRFGLLTLISSPVLSRMWPWAALLICCIAIPKLVFAAAALEPAAALQRAQRAAQTLSYSGVYIYQRGTELQTLGLTHVYAHGAQGEKRESLDGTPSETVRRGERMLTYFPRQRRLLIESREHDPGFPALPVLNFTKLLAYYYLKPLGEGQVAGRLVSGVLLESRDRWHYGYRFWLDQRTGLLLRAQTLSEKGEVVEQASFTQVQIAPIPASRLQPSVTSTEGWQVDNELARPLNLSAWHISGLPGGFERIGSWRRSMPAVPAAKGQSAAKRREVSQILYSDGLAGLSVFIEPWSAERNLPALQLGALNMLGKQHGKFWLTIVGDVPMGAIRQVADTIEFVSTPPK